MVGEFVFIVCTEKGCGNIAYTCRPRGLDVHRGGNVMHASARIYASNYKFTTPFFNANYL